MSHIPPVMWPEAIFTYTVHRHVSHWHSSRIATTSIFHMCHHLNKFLLMRSWPEGGVLPAFIVAHMDVGWIAPWDTSIQVFPGKKVLRVVAWYWCYTTFKFATAKAARSVSPVDLRRYWTEQEISHSHFGELILWMRLLIAEKNKIKTWMPTLIMPEHHWCAKQSCCYQAVAESRIQFVPRMYHTVRRHAHMWLPKLQRNNNYQFELETNQHDTGSNSSSG